MHDRAHRGALVLVACSMAFGFAWFDLPGHGASYVTRSIAMGNAITDGHTLFLWGMLGVTLLMAARPQWFERHVRIWLGIGWILGTGSLGTFSMAEPLWISALAVAVTGFADVLCINLIIGLILTQLCDRTQQMTAVTLALAAKTLLVYGSDRFLGASAQTALSIAVPSLCVACALGAQWLFGFRANAEGSRRCAPGHIKLAPPLSILMLGMLFVASIIFATTRVVSPIGFWGTDYPLSSWGPMAVLTLTLVYVVLCYGTLAKASSELLLRFLPPLLILFALYATLYSGFANDLGLPAGIIPVLQQYAELYGQAFVWAVALLAMRKLPTAPVRVMGILFTTFTVVELLLQRVLVAHGVSNLVLVLLSFFAVFGVLIWALCRFYGRGDDSQENIGANGDHGTQLQTPCVIPPAQSTPTDSRHLLASQYGLSTRETDVFLLLAQGRSRRFICEELFIADGTASTYISRVYEKLGVHSKQELLSLVLEREDAQAGDPNGCAG